MREQIPHVDRVEVVAYVEAQRGLGLRVRVREHAAERGPRSPAREEGPTPRRGRLERGWLQQAVHDSEQELVDRGVLEDALLPAVRLVQPRLDWRSRSVASGEDVGTDPEMHVTVEERLVFGDAVASARIARPERVDRRDPWFIGREVVKKGAGGRSL